MASQKIRLDILLTERGLVESRSLAQRMVMAGQVRVDGQQQLKASMKVAEDAVLEIEEMPKFVSRGGDKLEPALQSFDMTALAGKICADVGSSTGGFTDCLLQYGASKVYAIDVGYGILHWKLRTDERVVVMERTNARYVNLLPEAVDLVTVDASFISLRILLPVIRNWFTTGGGQVIALIKPQFEAGKKDAARNDGIIRDKQVHKRVLQEMMAFVHEEGFTVRGLIQSPIKGPKGNIEFLTLLHYPQAGSDIEVESTIQQLMSGLDEKNPLQKSGIGR